MKFVFSATEIKEILISAVVLSIAFAFAFSGGLLGAVKDLNGLPMLVVFSFIAVGIGFLAHELIGHKFFAQKFGLHAEFRMWRLGLGIAFLTSLFGVVFAAPGAVYISERMDLWGKPERVSVKRMGITSVMGPVINILVALIFLGVSLVYASLADLLRFGASINIWLALFNMIPFPPLDGSKVLAWNKRIFLAVIAVIAVLYIYFNLL